MCLKKFSALKKAKRETLSSSGECVMGVVELSEVVLSIREVDSIVDLIVSIDSTLFWPLLMTNQQVDYSPQGFITQSLYSSWKLVRWCDVWVGDCSVVVVTKAMS